ncbi:MAG: nucleoside/nucleotide kinase family protein [Lachnospiraceae bacterium]|nr:nucleoside/nucleotide kinase family protein [Lachnospiraceae bacterium]
MKYELNNSGIIETAEFDDQAVEQVFLPLVKQLTRLQKEKNRRVVAFLAAPPGAGKSTLAAFLAHLSRITEDVTEITTIGMDGFHRYQEYLLTHTTVRDGREIPMVKIKGAPVTFDLEKLTAAVERVAAGEECGWPVYDRLLHNPVEDAVQVTGDIVLLEGNYLLLDTEGWRELKKYADLTISLSADADFLRNRLVSRKKKTGTPAQEAEDFVDSSDMVNVQTCLNESSQADIRIQVLGDGKFI